MNTIQMEIVLPQSDGKLIANLLINDLKGLLKKSKLTIDQCPIKPELMGFLARGINQGTLTRKFVKKFLINTFEEYDSIRRDQG